MQSESFYFSCFEECFETIRNSNFFPAQKSFVKIKDGNNIQYDFDLKLDEIIKAKLKEHDVTGKIFSEESGFFENGKMTYRVVYDPFCNSTLFSRGISDAACGISIFDADYNFLSAGILDYQTGIVAITANKETKFFYLQNNGGWSPFEIKHRNNEEDVWLAVKSENKKERVSLDKNIDLFKFPDRLIIGSGHIYWLRLAMGAINGYIIYMNGERAYEMFASMVAINTGSIVTDLQGKKFDASSWLRKFEKDQTLRYKFVAASNKKIHKKLLELIRK